MFNLIKKDFILQKKMLSVYLVILAFCLYSDYNLVFVIMIVSSLFVMNSHYYDEKENAHILLNSLPYTRREIVSSKYLGAILFSLIVIPLGIAGQVIMDNKMLQEPLKIIVLSLLLVLFFTSFYLPFFYKFTQQYLLIGFTFIFILLVFLVNKLPILLSDHFAGAVEFVSELNDATLLSSLSLIAVVCYLVSWLLSVRIYQKKAF